MIYFYIFSSYRCKKLDEYKVYINKKIVHFKIFPGPGMGIRLPSEYEYGD